jgi:hypothetical protein
VVKTHSMPRTVIVSILAGIKNLQVKRGEMEAIYIYLDLARLGEWGTYMYKVPFAHMPLANLPLESGRHEGEEVIQPSTFLITIEEAFLMILLI